MTARPPSVRWVGFVVAATTFLTAFHFTDNIVNVNDYPRQDWLSAEFIQIAGVITWLAYVTAGIFGYRAYKENAFPRAHVLLLAFSLVGLISLLHFTAASPDELTTFGLVSVLVDVFMGSVVVATVLRSIIARRRDPVPTGV